jgi:hypothetical protein
VEVWHLLTFDGINDFHQRIMETVWQRISVYDKSILLVAWDLHVNHDAAAVSVPDATNVLLEIAHY